MSIRNILSKIYREFFPLSTEEMYRRMGVKIGTGCRIQNGVTIDHSHYWHVVIGNNVGIGPGTHILAHDTSTYHYFGYTKIGNVVFENNSFVGARSVILPGVVIGENSIVGAGSVVTKSIPPNTVYGGNPIKYICTLDEYVEKQKKIFDNAIKFSEDYTVRKNISLQKKQEMIDKIGDGYGFVI